MFKRMIAILLAFSLLTINASALSLTQSTELANRKAKYSLLPEEEENLKIINEKTINYNNNSVLVVIDKNCSIAHDIQNLASYNYKSSIVTSNDVASIEKLMEAKTNDGDKLIIKLNLSESGRKNIDNIISKLNSNPSIIYAEKNYELDLCAEPSIVTPNDPYYNQQYAMKKIQANRAWMLTKGTSINIGILDTGIYSSHTDIQNKMNNSLCANFSNSSSSNDNNGHGTHVAGIVAASSNNGSGVTGVSWNSKLVNIKCCEDNGQFYVDNVIEAINYAESHGIKIINCSFGITLPPASLRTAVEGFSGLIIASAGNDGTSVVKFPACYSYDYIISVGASDENDALCSFSNYSSTAVDLAAPGNAIISTSKNNSYVSKNGTSMAAPYVTGAAALIWGINPNFSRIQVKNYILNNVDEVTSLSSKVYTGGRLNVFKSVLDASGYIMGDVNFNGRIDAADARLVQRLAAQLEIFTNTQLAISDMNYDDVVNSADSRILLQMAAGLS